MNLVNEQNYTTTPLWNVIGILNGTIPDEVIVIGNHRDAWIAGGAGDPNSGSAALNEVIRAFGVAVAGGWTPQRTLVFASWDGEEYGLVGSTEWVEEYLPWLSSSTIAYINVDVGALGDRFHTAAAPLLNTAIRDIVDAIPSPNQTVPGQTVGDLWSRHIATMGSGSDFTAFQDFAGIASIDVAFGNDAAIAPVYHYHSNYDSEAWMEKYGDPTFEYHRVIAQVIALLAAKLGEEAVVAFNATEYASGLASYLRSIETLASEHEVDVTAFSGLRKAIAAFAATSIAFDAEAAALASLAAVAASSPSLLTTQEKKAVYARVHAVNTKYKLLERQFLYAPGLDSRTWFKHVVFAPGLWTGYAGATFPGIVEAVEEGDEEGVGKWVRIVKDAVGRAEGLLGGR